MYSNKENVNILTALLVAHGVRCAVVCPGSRNAPIVHNFNACPDMECYAVTDERSAGFYALGISLATGLPVAVCVTSGTALLNLAPAVAEAYYQHVPLIVISADRPQRWIDQLDGQTLPQPDALGRFVRKSVALPEIAAGSSHADEERWHCNRLVNEALLDAQFRSGAPVHINVPISEPLFQFTQSALPRERKIERRFPRGDDPEVEKVMTRAILNAKRPMIVIGQTRSDFICDDAYRQVMRALSEHFVVLTERLCNYGIETVHFDEVLYQVGDDMRYQPDVVVYAGDSIVSKRLKRFLRNAEGVQVYRLSTDGAVADTFLHLSEITVCHPEHALAGIASRADESAADPSFFALWQESLRRASRHAEQYLPDYSQMAAVKWFEEHFSGGVVHYANSTSIRLANIYSCHPVYCNRGVNGIEGSLSTAAGFSVVSQERVFCVIGDLSFFYDQNALWNQNLRGNFRILLLNNEKGGIFNQLKGLEQSSARDRFVAGEHHASAEGICMQNDIVYLKAVDEEQMRRGIGQLMAMESRRPVLLEVFTDDAKDEQAFRDYYRSL
ncbi:MAG: 2-succinyl-5-enolpyruvyl-6-hydroxy-3-cyclohexene-1-carboxylic-acid synthase [Prevotella sp.]|nr:2-succinyl-5-enolpyruvyl-6-hydroxy-3-cyclohexene-1-carboxylic-acid synthase [Prevotella sp.]